MEAAVVPSQSTSAERMYETCEGGTGSISYSERVLDIALLALHYRPRLRSFRGIRIRHRQAATAAAAEPRGCARPFARGFAFAGEAEYRETARQWLPSTGFSSGLPFRVSRQSIAGMVYEARDNLYTTPDRESRVERKREEERGERTEVSNRKVKGYVVKGSSEPRECRYGASTAG